MANKEHLRIIRQGVDRWNQWRKDNPDVDPDLSGANLKGFDLKKADLSGADIRGTNFKGADLDKAVFVNAKAGQRPPVSELVLFVSLFYSTLSGFFSLFGGIWFLFILDGTLKIKDEYIQLSISLPFFAIFMVIMIIAVRRKKFYSVASALGLTAAGAAMAGVLAEAGTAILTGRTTAEATITLGIGAGAGAGAAALAGAAAGALALAAALALAGSGVVALAGAASVALALAFAAANSKVLLLAGGCIIILSCYIAWRTIKEDEQFAGLRRLSIFFASLGGTNFQGASLSEAKFSNTLLKNSRFNKDTNIIRTLWRDAKKLEFASVTATILENRSVRELLVTGKIESGNRQDRIKSFAGISLKGAHLAGINLDGIDFTEADLSGATLENTSLRNANLTKTQCLGVEFRGADLTGACLESWNIDSTTQLEGAHADYVYLLGNHQERRPSSGNFGEKEFSKLFQEVLDTVDLIFRDGIDWQAFMVTFDKLREKIRVESEDADIRLQSIEDKGDGVFVVRVNVSSRTDKSEVHSKFNQEYDNQLKLVEDRYKALLEAKEKEITIYREHNTDLKEIIQWQTERPVKVEAKAEANMGDNINVNAERDVALAKDQGRAEIKDGLKSDSKSQKKIAGPRIFISYAEDDRLIADKIYADLQKEGITPWVTHKNVKAGEKTNATVRKAIKESDYFLALLSVSSVSEKGTFQKELKQAFDILAEFPLEHSFVIPVRLDDCDPGDDVFNNLHIIDLHMTGYKNGLKKIMQALKNK